VVHAAWTAVRVALIWAAFHGTGLLVTKLVPARRRGDRFFPAVVPGMLAHVFLTLPLSLFGILTRWFLSILIIPAASVGMLDILRKLRRNPPRIPSPFRLFIPAAFLLSVLFLSLLFHAALPHGMVDPLITYAVQPDRWLDAGRMHILDETIFSFFPSVGEMLATWPAALSDGRLDQLSILQVFQVSMLAASFLLAARSFRLGWMGYMSLLLLGLSSPILSKWGSFAKVDMTAVFFTTAFFSYVFEKWALEGKKIVNEPMAWFLLGVAIGVKWTVLLTVAALVPVLVAGFVSGERSGVFRGLLLASAVPLVFVLRNLLVTGEPFYPFHLPPFTADAAWRIETVPALDALRQHGHASPAENLKDLFLQWGLTASVFIAGVPVLFRRSRMRAAVVLAGILLYALVCSVVFDPVSWGGKYTLLLLPVMAALGFHCLSSRKEIILAVLIPLVLLTSSFPGRLRFIVDFVSASEPAGFRDVDFPPALPLHEWTNANLPPGTRLLSLWRPERYFSDHEVLVLQNHPDGVELLFDDGVEDELKVLRRMKIDYVYFCADDPMPGDLEKKVALLSAVGEGGPLEPVVQVSGYLLCKVNR